VPHETADRFQPYGQDPPAFGNENLTDNVATVCGSKQRSFIGGWESRSRCPHHVREL